jgi:hypothetical protein
VAGSPDGVPLPQSRQQKLKDALLALSFANLCFADAVYYTQLDVGFDYFKKLPLTQATLLGLVVNLLGLAALFWLGIRAVRRYRRRWLWATCEWLFLLLWLLPLDFCRGALLGLYKHQLVAFLKRPTGALVLLLVLACVVWQRKRIVRAAVVVTLIMSPLAFIMLGQIALASFGPHHPLHHVREPMLAPLSPVREGQPRVVWMIFDETDYRLVFDQRPAGVQMPEFDRLRRESLFATNAYPPGPNTTESLPGLITGRRVSAASPRNDSDLWLTLADSGKVVAWSQLPSVFDSARELGVNTALVGWHHPYARVLGRSLNYCSWYPYTRYDPVRALTLGRAMRNELGCLVFDLHFRRLYVEMCRATLEDSLALVTNATYGMVFLHLGPPHDPGVFNPATGQYTILDLSKVRGYFNNLALADRNLGSLRHAMETSGQWDRSWVILSADHSWRQSSLYDGHRDFRVPFFIKAPGVSQTVVYSSEINTLITGDLVLAILRGNLTNQQQTVAWLDAHPSAPPPAARPPARE